MKKINQKPKKSVQLLKDKPIEKKDFDRFLKNTFQSNSTKKIDGNKKKI